MTAINPNLGPKRSVGPKATEEDRRMRAEIITKTTRTAQTIIDGDRLLKKRKRQSKMKTKADTPVP